MSIKTGKDCPHPQSLTDNSNEVDLKNVFKNDPATVELQLRRANHLDVYGLPLMPVPAMVGPFERLKRIVRVRVVSAGEEPRTIRNKDDSLDLFLKDNKEIDLGISCLKVQALQNRTHVN